MVGFKLPPARGIARHKGGSIGTLKRELRPVPGWSQPARSMYGLGLILVFDERGLPSLGEELDSIAECVHIVELFLPLLVDSDEPPWPALALAGCWQVFHRFP